jgi:predicted nucleic acid-binding protein
MPSVLDASAATRAVMDPAGQPSLLKYLADAPLVFAPALLRVECANALWKYTRSGAIDASAAVVRHIEAMSLVHRFVDDGTLFPEALQLAFDFGHPVYDAVYAVTARRHTATLLTFNRRLRDLCDRARIECTFFGG